MDVKSILARNLEAIRSDSGSGKKISQRELQSRTGVSQRQFSNLLRCEKAANVDTLEKIARAFGLAPWQLLHPNMPTATDPSSDLLLRAFGNATVQGRSVILHIAEREAAPESQREESEL